MKRYWDVIIINKKISKKNNYILGIQIFSLLIMNIFLWLILDEFTDSKIKFTLIGLCIFTTTILGIISIIVAFKN